MPVFVGRRPANLRGEALHESYRPGETVYELTLNRRAVKVLEALGIRTIGELLVTPKEILTDQWAFGPATLKAIHGELKRLLLGGAAEQEAAVDFSSFAALVKGLIGMAAENPRDVEVLEKRLGVSDEGRWSLGKLGKKYGLTRERIRQIEEVGLWEMSMRARRKSFRDFWRTVTEIVRGAGGRCELAFMARELARRCNWPELPNVEGLAKLLGICPQLHVDRRQGIVSMW